MTEVERIRNGYWWYSPAGIPLPGFVLDLFPSTEYQDNFIAWIGRHGARQVLVSFYLESKYRAAGGATQAELDSWCQRASGMSPELSVDARALEREFTAAQAMIERDRVAAQKSRMERERAQSAAGQLQREIAEKMLPAGREPNLMIMRKIVKK